MARRINMMTTLTPTVYADATNLANSTYPNLLQSGAATQLNKIWEISLSGQAASSSSPTFMILSRDGTVGSSNAQGTGQSDQPMDPATAALAAPALTGINNSTVPQRSSSGHLANCSVNAFGGVYFWRANRLEECFSVLGQTAPLGEVSLSAFTGSTAGAIGSHMIYESL